MQQISIFNSALPDSFNVENNLTFTAQPITNDHWRLFVSIVSFSLLCLLITLILYLLIWEKHNCQGWTQFSYLLALFLFDSVFITALCPGLSNGVKRNQGCKILSILNQYFFISAKTWLIIISLDLFSTIRDIRIIARESSKNISRFIIYASIGWTFPLVFVTVGIILNLQNQDKLQVITSDSNLSDLWTEFPDYGFQHCRIPTWNIWEYFVIANCIFHCFMFALICITIIWQMRRIATLADINGSNISSGNRPSPFLMLFKLFIVVGLSWSYIAAQDLLNAGNINTKQSWGWHIFRCIYFLQGAFISVITLTNGKLVANLIAKYPSLKGIRSIFTINSKVFSELRQRFSLNGRKESLQSCTSQRTFDSIIT